MFGWTIIRKDRLKRLEMLEVKVGKFWQVHRWFAGWRDLDIIWEYLIQDTNFGGIERARKDYAEARGTNEYGSSLESLVRLDKTIKEQLARANEAAELANAQPRRQDGEGE